MTRQLTAEDYARLDDLQAELTAAGYATDPLDGESRRAHFLRLESLAGVARLRNRLTGHVRVNAPGSSFHNRDGIDLGPLVVDGRTNNRVRRVRIGNREPLFVTDHLTHIQPAKDAA